MGLYIEIIGNPGSGKSTFYKAVLRHLKHGGINTFHRKNELLDRRLLTLYMRKLEQLRPPDRFREGLNYIQDRIWGRFTPLLRMEPAALKSFICMQTELVELILGIHVRRAISPWEKEHILERYFNSFAHFQIAQTVMNESDAILMDPGFVQRGIALLGYGIDEKSEHDLQEYLRLTPLPDLLISVEAPPEVCMTRMQQRSFSHRLLRMSKEAVEAALNRCETYLHISKERLHKRGASLIELENTGHLQPSLAKLHEELALFLSLSKARRNTTLAVRASEDSSTGLKRAGSLRER